MDRVSRKVVVRADGSASIGSGHVMRCLTLADELRDAGADITFVSRDLPGNLFELIRAQRFRLVTLGYLKARAGNVAEDWRQDLGDTLAALRSRGTIDWLVVDHYGLDCRWERGVRVVSRKLMAIDDLANRPHDCDLLLDQNYYRNAQKRYLGLVPKHCKLFLGPRYALLRKEFRGGPVRRHPIRDIERILVFFGGADLSGETQKVLEALQGSDLTRLTVDVVVGSSNPNITQVRDLCAPMTNVTLHVQTERMAELMTQADLTIGAGGATTWERCRLGLPTLTVVTAPNQEETTRDLAAAGAIWYLGQGQNLEPSDYREAIRQAINSPNRLAEMARQATVIMNGCSNDVQPDGLTQLTHLILGAGPS